jgi:phospholipid transport system transporter-binding protein
VIRATAQLAEKAEGRCAISGALTFETVPWIWQQLGEGTWLRKAREADLSGVTAADSAGLALLVAWRAAVIAANGALKFEAVPERLVALARLTEAESLLAD